MEPPVTNIEHFVLGQMYSIYEDTPDWDDPEDEDKWSTLPAHTATYLGVGLHYGDRLAVFRSEQHPATEQLADHISRNELTLPPGTP